MPVGGEGKCSTAVPAVGWGGKKPQMAQMNADGEEEEKERKVVRERGGGKVKKEN